MRLKLGTSVGSKSLSLRQALFVAAIFEFCGAYFVGAHVTDTIRKGIVDVDLFTNDPALLMVCEDFCKMWRFDVQFVG